MFDEWVCLLGACSYFCIAVFSVYHMYSHYAKELRRLRPQELSTMSRCFRNISSGFKPEPRWLWWLRLWGLWWAPASEFVLPTGRWVRFTIPWIWMKPAASTTQDYTSPTQSIAGRSSGCGGCGCGGPPAEPCQGGCSTEGPYNVTRDPSQRREPTRCMAVFGQVF